MPPCHALSMHRRSDVMRPMLAHCEYIHETYPLVYYTQYVGRVPYCTYIVPLHSIIGWVGLLLSEADAISICNRLKQIQITGPFSTPSLSCLEDTSRQAPSPRPRSSGGERGSKYAFREKALVLGRPSLFPPELHHRSEGTTCSHLAPSIARNCRTHTEPSPHIF